MRGVVPIDIHIGVRAVDHQWIGWDIMQIVIVHIPVSRYDESVPPLTLPNMIPNRKPMVAVAFVIHESMLMRVPLPTVTNWRLLLTETVEPYLKDYS